MKSKLFLAFFLAAGFFVSCDESSDEEVLVAPEERIVGQWVVENLSILGQTAPGDGSYLEFNACDTECTGVDYMASDQSSGTFTYSLNAAGTEITIVDDSPDGGSYNGTWTISDFTNNSMRVSGSTILGEMSMNMSKTQ